jgi:hypothetical protein
MSDESRDQIASPRATITVELDSEEEARVVGDALSVDDDEWVRTMTEDRLVKAVITSDTVEGLKRAGDDWLACLIAAMKGPKGGTLDEAEGSEGHTEG